MDSYEFRSSSGQHDTLWLRAAAWLLGILALILLFMGTLLRDRFTVEQPAAFNPVTVVRGSYVYLDAVGISDAVGNYDGTSARFFTAEDAGGYLYIVKMKPSELSRMKEQNEWWKNRSSGNMPEPYRIYGCAAQMSSSERSQLASALGFDTEHIENYFGQKYLDTTRTPLSVFNICLIFLGCYILCFSLFILIFSRPPKAFPEI